MLRRRCVPLSGVLGLGRSPACVECAVNVGRVGFTGCYSIYLYRLSGEFWLFTSDILGCDIRLF